MLRETGWSKDLEKPIYEEWKKSKINKFDSKSKKPIYSIDTPPPYVNAPVHMGHCTTYILMDMFARFKRMTGHEVLFPLGLDRNGLPIEVAAEKKFNVRPGSIPREKFIEYCKKLLEEFSTKSTETFLRSGISFSSWDPGNKPGDLYFTDSDEYRKLTQSTFIDLWKNGMVYEDKRLNNYCVGCRTTVADNEVDHIDKKTFLSHVKVSVKGSTEEIVIATTRPELLCTAAMIVYHPDDKRYQHLKGKKAIIPIYNTEVPIQPHPIAKPEYGSGILYMSKSAGDQNAIRFLIEMKIEAESCITTEGKMDKNSGFLEGLKVEEARQAMIERLEKEGSLVKKEEIMHSTPICERSKHAIEFITMPEYYVKQMDFLKDVKDVSDKINFYSEKNKQLLLDWLGSVSIDWPISRRRVYATEIPLWYCKKCREAVVPEKGKYYQPWKDPSPIKECTKCKCKEFEGEARVFDTWFDSSISPLYILQYVEDPEFFKKTFPATLRPQGKEIVRTWLYYTLLRCYQLTEKPAFKDVWIHFHILDGQGRKMSKSLGNVVDPASLIDKFGAEPVRLWAALEGNLVDTDFACSEPKIQGNGKFLTKLWNVARFISGIGPDKTLLQGKLVTDYIDGRPENISVLDQWILSELNKLAELSRKQFEVYDFHNPTTKIRHFIWEIFASHYLELVKSRAYNIDNKFSKEEQQSAIWTLNYCLDVLLKLLAPVIPFITYKIYSDLKDKNIHMEKFPTLEKIEFKDFTTDELVELNSAIWKAKKDKELSLKDPLEYQIPKKFKLIERELKEMHKLS